jgi:meso-butanediol dehydrogenase/(S,S)-butanediol dehydrogenase/diacetyl reductase
MYPDLKDKVAIVTGAGRQAGLGAAIVRRLAADGARVVIHDIGQANAAPAPAGALGLAEEMEALAAELRAGGAEVATVRGDLLIEADVEAMVAHTVATFGRIDILVNNAGVGYLFAPLLEMTQERWDTTLGVNLRGAFFALRHVARQMVRQGPAGDWGAGRIISIASRAAKSGSAYTSAYVASKHGLIGLTRAAAVELGPHRINVNAVCPNHVTTGLGAWQNDFMSKARGLSVEDYLAAMRARIPLGRVGLVEDTARAVAFLCSGEANYITGEAMNVSGGEEMH